MMLSREFYALKLIVPLILFYLLITEGKCFTLLVGLKKSSGNVFINDFVHFYNGQHLSVGRMLKYFYRVN